MAGYVKVHRKLLNSAIWQNVNDWRLAETILLKANWKPGVFQTRSGDVVKVARGEWVTSLDSMMEYSGLSIQSIRTSLKHLRKEDFLTIRPTQLYTIIKVINYGRYNDTPKPC